MKLLRKLRFDELAPFMRSLIRAGGFCEECGQKVCFKKLILHRRIVKFVSRLDYFNERYGPDAYFKTVELFPKDVNFDGDVNKVSNDGPYARHFGLIETQKGHKNGLDFEIMAYRITPLGREFLKGLARVPAYVRTYNNMVVEPASELVDVHQANKAPYDRDAVLEKKGVYR